MSAVRESDFASWNLHDAILYSITMDWESKECVAAMGASLKPREHAIPCTLRWENITEVHISHNEPWGPSVIINRRRMDKSGAYVIQMRSGDELRIPAERVSLGTGLEVRPKNLVASSWWGAEAS